MKTETLLRAKAIRELAGAILRLTSEDVIVGRVAGDVERAKAAITELAVHTGEWAPERALVDWPARFRQLSSHLGDRACAPSLAGYELVDGLFAAALLLEGEPGPWVDNDDDTDQVRLDDLDAKLRRPEATPGPAEQACPSCGQITEAIGHLRAKGLEWQTRAESAEERLRSLVASPVFNEGKDTSMQTDAIMQFFEYEHLPPKLQEISRPFCELAKSIVAEPNEADSLGLPRNAERSVALRKLLEAKDCAVRASLFKPAEG